VTFAGYTVPMALRCFIWPGIGRAEPDSVGRRQKA
jgi:hypothetical protein